jgi:alpha-L-fucosidase
VDIVSKGGNFLLNIGPNAEGNFAPEADDRLNAIGDWMRVNQEAIYGTRPVAPYKETKICFTEGKDGSVYAIYLGDEDESAPPAKVMIYSHCPPAGGKIRLLGAGGFLTWERAGKGTLIHLPATALRNPPCRHAWAFKITAD